MTGVRATMGVLGILGACALAAGGAAAQVKDTKTAPAPIEPIPAPAHGDLTPSRVTGGAPAASARVAASVRNAYRVVEVSDGGRFVTLDDGTIWEVYYQHRPTADAWSANSSVVVRESYVALSTLGRGSDTHFDHTIGNAEAGRVVWARFAGMR